MDTIALQQFRDKYLQKHPHINPAVHGCSLEDIAEYERECGLSLPLLYKEVLLLGGRFPESNPVQNMYSFPEIMEANEMARDIEGQFLDFPPNAPVLYMFEGYQMQKPFLSLGVGVL